MKGANIWGTNIQGLEIENMSRQVPVGPATLEELGAVRRDPMVEENNRMLKEVLAKLGEKA